ncbi:NUDIX hydrolase [Aureimonas frigidaquae]|uniref:NUDIX hydrolase n=1 Tax=Aureimonas frigidaquae TaxID=424757 RepID=UPI000B0A34A3|nr:NUDIX hydrolase [Aureimonas frigidaquae]
MADKKARKRPNKDVRQQVAALPLRIDEDDNLRVLLITSRETQRWVLPKGNLMRGKTPARAAAIEALEEAGVVGKIYKKPYDTFQYWKRGRKAFIFADVTVFLLVVTGMRATWKEQNQRRMVWVTPAQAAVMVVEPSLQALLQNLELDDATQRLVRKHLQAADEDA